MSPFLTSFYCQDLVKENTKKDAKKSKKGL